MPLFGGDTELELQVDADTVVAGGTVHARVRVGEPDEKVCGGEVFLVYRNTWKKEISTGDGGTQEVKTRDDVYVASAPIYEEGAPVEPREVEVELTVPDWGPPSDPDAVEWKVRAQLDREHAMDSKEDVPLTVLIDPEPYANRASSEPEAEGDLPMELALEGRSVRAGDTVTGQLTITPGEDVKARGVRVQLRRLRSDEDDCTDEDVVAEQDLDGSGRLAAGEPHSYAFEIALPADAAPCFDAEHNSQQWFLEAVVDRRLRADRVLRAELNVYNA